MKIVAVTKCPVGVAHTYIAAGKLEKTAKALDVEIKVETQGSQGVENRLTEEDIKNADYVIISADVSIAEPERFGGKKVYETSIKDVLKNSEDIFKNISNLAKIQKVSSTTNTSNKGGSSTVKNLMNGVSHMLPFVVVGGLFIALSLSLGGTPTDTGLSIPENSLFNKMLEIGVIGFTLMIPILAGFIAMSISGRAALAPAMICATVANNPAILGTKSGTGFIGAIVVGFLVGYIVKWMNTWKVPQSLKAIMPIFVIPILTVTIVSVLFITLLGIPISYLMDGLNTMLAALSESKSTSVILGAILGLMIAFDMGGPVNKVAFLFGVASIAANNSIIMGAVAAAIPVPPLAMGVSTLISKKLYNEEEIAAGIPALLMGMIGITEGAIPFASADPMRVLPSIMVGSAAASVSSMLFKITNAVPHGGPIVGILGATSNMLLFLLSIIIGVAVSVLMLHILKVRKK